jgi:hypothetical protein
MHSALDVGAVVLSAPLVVSLTLTGWSALWSGLLDGPLRSPFHALLLAAQAGAVLALLAPTPRSIGFVAGGALYLAMGLGAAILLLRRGEVPCGCWGRTGHLLGWRLVIFNVVMGLVSVALTASSAARGMSLADSMHVLLVIVALTLTGGVLVPEGRYALRGVTTRADKSRRWFEDFPDLEEA